MTEPTIREPDQIRQDCAKKLRAVQVSDHFQAILGCLLGEDWTTPRLVEMVITPDGHLLGRCDGEEAFKAFLGAADDLIKNIHGVAPVAELDGDEIGFLVGKVAGKSFLVQAISYQAIKAGFVVLYRSIFDVVRDFLHDDNLGNEAKMLAKYLKPDLLVIDDMGMKQLPKRSGEYLFEIIMRRYETRSTMMTSNRPLEDWGKLIGDVPSATAILDRFLHHAEIIQITGKSYRLRNHGRSLRAVEDEVQPESKPASPEGGAHDSK